MLLGNDVTRLRRELAVDLAAPRAVFKDLARPGGLLNRRNVLPSLVVAWPISTMQRIEDANARLSRSIQDLQHVRDASIRFSDVLQTIPYFAALGNEIVERIDHQKCSDLFLVCCVLHVSLLLPPQRLTFDAFCEQRRLLPVMSL